MAQPNSVETGPNYESITYLPEGNHERIVCTIAFVGSQKIPIQWAAQMIQLQYPVNAQRGMYSIAHENIDVSRNITLYEWLKSIYKLSPTAAWIVLVPVGEHCDWDFAPRAVTLGARVVKCGNVFAIRADALKEAPWFANNKWLGETPLEIDSVVYAPPPGGIRNPQKHTLVAIPSFGYTSLTWLTYAMQLSAPLGANRSLMIQLKEEVGIARQTIVDVALSLNPRPEWLLFYGDDNLPPHNALWLLSETMEKTGYAAVSGLYYMKNARPEIPIMWRNDKQGVLKPEKDFQWGDAVEVDGTGLDFVLIKTSALAQMPPLKFKTTMEWLPGQGMVCQTEDAFFWDRWKETFGKGPLVDTRVRVGHYSVDDGGVY